MTSPLPDEPTDEKVYEDLKRLEGLGVLEYIVPTEPLGEEWLLGYKGQIIKLVGKGEALAFLTGANMVAVFLAERTGARI